MMLMTFTFNCMAVPSLNKELLFIFLHDQPAGREIKFSWVEDRAEGRPEETMSGALFALSKLEF